MAAVPTKNANPALFYTQKCPERGFTANTLTQFFLTLYVRAGIEGASSHSGRRSFATALAAKGTGLVELVGGVELPFVEEGFGRSKIAGIGEGTSRCLDALSFGREQASYIPA